MLQISQNSILSQDTFGEQWRNVLRMFEYIDPRGYVNIGEIYCVKIKKKSACCLFCNGGGNNIQETALRNEQNIKVPSFWLKKYWFCKIGARSSDLNGYSVSPTDSVKWKKQNLVARFYFTNALKYWETRKIENKCFLELDETFMLAYSMTVCFVYNFQTKLSSKTFKQNFQMNILGWLAVMAACFVYNAWAIPFRWALFLPACTVY